MPNVISGHISGNYGGPRSCDTYYGPFRSATSCASNAGDCSHTVIVGTTGVSIFSPGYTVYPDNITILEGRAYTGPAGCTTITDYNFYSYPTALTYVTGSFYVNPGQCVELNFTVDSRAYVADTVFCDQALQLSIQGATAPNLGVLSGEWYSDSDSYLACCGQINKLCAPTGSGNSHSATLSYKMFRDDFLAYESDTNTFCCQPRAGCGAGTPSVRPVYDASYPSCIAFYARECYYSPNPPLCLGGTFTANQRVMSDMAPAKYASYIYCADQPCGAKISFQPMRSADQSFNWTATVDAKIYLSLTGSPGCGTGC